MAGPEFNVDNWIDDRTGHLLGNPIPSVSYPGAVVGNCPNPDCRREYHGLQKGVCPGAVAWEAGDHEPRDPGSEPEWWRQVDYW